MRKNLNIPEHIHEWYEIKAKELNIPTSAIMVIALNEYMKQDGALKTLDGVLMAMKEEKK